MKITGAKYESGRDVAEIAKLIRADVKAAQKSGALSKSLKVAVRISRYSMGCSLYVIVQSAPFQVLNSDFVREHVTLGQRSEYQGPRLTKLAQDTLDTLEVMLAEYRQHETDCNNTNFYPFVKFSSDVESGELAIQTEHHRALAA